MSLLEDKERKKIFNLKHFIKFYMTSIELIDLNYFKLISGVLKLNLKGNNGQIKISSV